MTGARLLELSPGATLVELPGVAEEEANAEAIALADVLRRSGQAGLLDAIPGARSLLLHVDPAQLDRDILSRRVHGALAGARGGRETGRIVRIPVRYGGGEGPDLLPLAVDLGIPTEELIRLHAAGRYRVGFLGFAPGFAYLLGLAPDLSAPRLPTPRKSVPAGSVAIGAEYTGVYPGGTAGGWRVIGRTSTRLFDEEADPPSLLRPGDAVIFESVTGLEFGRTAGPAPPSEAAGESQPVFRVLQPGAFTSVQGAPRFGQAASGIPPGGAMDAPSLFDGNSLVGNGPEAGALEIALSGPTLQVMSDVRVCLCGADVATGAGGTPLTTGAPRRLRAGERLEIGPVTGGARAYLCVEGGLLAAGRLGVTRRLSAGDEVARSTLVPRPAAPPRPFGVRRTSAAGRSALRVVLDPRAPERIGAEKIRAFFETTYRVSGGSDRKGIRLEGPALFPRESAGVPPEGTTLGTIQVPGDGLPIVLGPDRPVTGGYAKLGALVEVDFALLAQAPPGASIRFREVRLSEALEAGSSIP